MSLLLYIPSAMVFWSSYYNSLTILRRIRAQLFYNPNENSRENLLLMQAIAGSLGGISAAIVTNPLEVLRVRIQVIHIQIIVFTRRIFSISQVHRTSYFETARRIYKFEGSDIFTKGLLPRMINNGIYSCLIMIGYETVKRFTAFLIAFKF